MTDNRKSSPSCTVSTACSRFNLLKNGSASGSLAAFLATIA